MQLDILQQSVLVEAATAAVVPAFDAALDGINRVKKIVPIWKKEFFEDGEVWGEGEWDDSVKKAQ